MKAVEHKSTNTMNEPTQQYKNTERENATQTICCVSFDFIWSANGVKREQGENGRSFYVFT